MSETPFFFPRGDVRLFGVLHRPAGATPRTGFVLSHPFAEEKLWSHRVFVSLARALAERGHAVLRFDYSGAGDSAGTTLDTSLETHLADLGAAVGTLAEREPGLERVGLVGLRLGATFAALAMERAADGSLPAALRTGPLVLWEPVVDGAAYIQDVMRSNLSAQLASFGKVVETREVLQQRILEGGSVNIDGYELGRDLFVSCHRPDLLPTSAKAHEGPTLITPIAPARKQKPRADLEALAAGYPRSRVIAADEEPFWREIKQFYGRAERLQALTLDWLEGAHD
jgi:uncharacterized protein